MTPSNPQSPAQTLPAEEPRETAPVYYWYHKMSAVVFITFCLEIGLFLLIFPWTEYWPANYFSTALPILGNLWENMYLRGAVSGLGMVNLYISFLEIFRLRRFARH